MRNRRNKRVKPQKYKGIKIASGVCVFIGLVFISVIFSITNMTNERIIKGVKIEGISFSGLTQEEATKKIREWYENTALKPITLQYEEIEDNISLEEFDPHENLNKSVEKALLVGRSGNIIKDNYEILFTMIFKKDINVDITYDEEKLDKRIDEVSGKLPDAVVQTNYYIEDDNLIIKKGSAGTTIKKDELKKDIKNAIKVDDKEITIPTKNVDIEKIDIDKIHKEIYKEAKDARIEDNPIKVYAEVNGVDFAISIDEAKKIIAEDKDEYVIPLKIIEPEVTLAQIGTQAFPELLSEFTTRYDASNKNRSNNLMLASDKINGTVIMPGETFSYNKTVGARTIAAGYKEAAVYSGGRVVEGIGGGICQLSSTLYNAVLYANLEVTSRCNHRFLTSYVQAGRDATVSWGTIDFCFINTRSYPVKIVTSVINGIVKVQFWGIKEEKEYEVEIQTTILEEIDYKTTYKYSNSIEEGKEGIEQYGSKGAKSETYKIVSLDGKIVSKTLLSTDTYSSLERVVVKGTKKVTEEKDENNENVNQISDEDENIIRPKTGILDGDTFDNE